ncbi:amidohydrolase [Paroceanicella profunda]|uniref:Amidohydrolase n=1 Tax=Paroceanicella profunda TaxID=2579971 RepID=A0A5B8FY57_9RHOB|nr:amidohydrolase family protein [Paroceanicella profunda]QDL91539.1 amidohydrolase [Paroceanicella profunda]
MRTTDGPAPKLKAPPGATDCHIHIYYPGVPSAPGGPPVPEPATPEDYRQLMARLGLERVIVTQSNAFQGDNTCTLRALEEFGDIARGVVAVTPETTEAELARWHERGARGARIMDLGGAARLDVAQAVAEKVKPFGWHLMVQFDGRDFERHEAALTALPVPFILDHVGKFLEPVAPDSPAMDAFLRVLKREDTWAKLCAGYETSKLADWSDVGAMAARIVEAVPDRLLWGSNWPHVGVKPGTAPDDARLLDLMLDWVPDETTRNRMLVDTPAALYGF